DLETDVSARNVIETLAVQRADLHVFDRLGLDGKIGSLRPRNRDKSCCGAEEKTFRHLHSNLHCASWKGSVQPGLVTPPMESLIRDQSSCPAFRLRTPKFPVTTLGNSMRLKPPRSLTALI